MPEVGRSFLAMYVHVGTLIMSIHSRVSVVFISSSLSKIVKMQNSGHCSDWTATESTEYEYRDAILFVLNVICC